jgi:broad specificity phosphatase PhoE
VFGQAVTPIQEGESLQQLQARYTKALDSLARQHGAVYELAK